MEQKPSRQAKDHVFVDIFNQPKYCLALFNALHPEATDITEADIQNITISHVIVDKPYNDLGFTVKGRQLILVEAQASWSQNILIRLLMYFIDSFLPLTWKRVSSTRRAPTTSSGSTYCSPMCTINR